MNDHKQLAKLLLFGISTLFLASCATNERVDFSINPSTDNQELFACTILAIEQHNLPHLNIDPNHPSKYSAFPPTFQENIIKSDLTKGTLFIGKVKTAMYDYPLNLSRKRDNVILRSSSYGIYYSHDQHLKPTLFMLSDKIQQCLPASDDIHSVKNNASQ